LNGAAAVADTHAAIWYLFADPRLSASARNAFDRAGSDGRKVLVSSITLAEMVYLVEKCRISQEVYDRLCGALADPEHILAEAPLTSAIVESMRQIPREQVPDLPDRIVAATALYFNVPAISRDSRILASNLTTIW
jgi:PIN domain nuclease of toxin-antitoxin system